MSADTANHRFLVHLAPGEEKDLTEKAPLQRYSADEVILDQGLVAKALFLIVAGSVRVERHEDGQVARLATLSAGECFGEMSFVDGGPTSAKVVADEATAVRVITGEVIAAREKHDPSFAGRLYRSISAILSERLRLTSQHLDTLIAGIDFFSQVKGEMESALAKLPGTDWRSDLVSVMVQRERQG